MSYRGFSLTFIKDKADCLDRFDKIRQQLVNAVDVGETMINYTAELLPIAHPKSGWVENVDTGWRDVTIKLRYKVSI